MKKANGPTYGQVIFKASHNSYAESKKESISEQLTFPQTKPKDGGCMGIEFDIWRFTSDYTPGVEIDEKFFRVSHLRRPDVYSLKHYLDKVKEWHNANPQHDIVLITIDIKSEDGGYSSFHDQIDTYLKTHFDENFIFKPKDIEGLPDDDLCSRIVKNGWPTLEEMRGKFIFCLSGNKDWKSEYTRNDLLTQRLCFSDLDKPDDDKNVTPPDAGNIVFFNFHIWYDNRGVWMNVIPAFSGKNLITRTYEVDSENNWKSCVDSNVSAIATNKISGNEWTKFANDRLYAQKYSLHRRSLKNKSNGEFRTDKATTMRDTFVSPDCVFIFEKLNVGVDYVYAIRNAKNSEYLDCTITTMSPKVSDDCQRWEVIAKDLSNNEFYIKNRKNHKYLTKRASQLHNGEPGNDEVYILRLET